MSTASQTLLTRMGKGLFGRLRRDAATEWSAYTNHDFLRALAAGTLPEETFCNYLIQDYLYLIQFTRAYALAVYKSRTLEEMRRMAESLAAILREMPLHVAFCNAWGISEADMHAAPESLELLAYSRFLLDCGSQGDVLDLTVALSACVVGYADIGARLIADPATEMDNNPYRAWIETYGGDDYINVALQALDTLDLVAQGRGSDARYPTLLQTFRTAARLEALFWEAGS